MHAAHSLLWIKTLLVGGFAGYLTLFVLNNVMEPGTNSAAVPRMMTMRELKDDPPLGKGVLWRAIDSPLIHRLAYRGVVVVQTAAAVLLWRAAVMLILALAHGYAAGDVDGAIAAANLGMLVFLGLAFAFVLTGLWFMSWVKLGPMEGAHTTMLFLALFGVIAINVGA
jgi:predicted small integral membrane protein